MKFRPENDPRNGPDPVDWTDSGLSNSLAWASYRLTPGWCQTPEHWTSRLSNYVWTDCPCCLLFRGVFIGGAIGGAISFAAGAIAAAILLAAFG